MAKGVRETIGRIRGLLDGSIAATGRALATSLTDWTDLSKGERDAASEQAPRSFVLEHVGTEDDATSLISQPVMRQWEVMQLTLSVFMGGGVNAGSDYGEAQSLLGEITEGVRKLLEDPNNMNRATTGWLYATGWRVGPAVLVNGRLVRRLAFRCVVEQDVGAL